MPGPGHWRRAWRRRNVKLSKRQRAKAFEVTMNSGLGIHRHVWQHACGRGQHARASVCAASFWVPPWESGCSYFMCFRSDRCTLDFNKHVDWCQSWPYQRSIPMLRRRKKWWYVCSTTHPRCLSNSNTGSAMAGQEPELHGLARMVGNGVRILVGNKPWCPDVSQDMGSKGERNLHNPKFKVECSSNPQCHFEVKGARNMEGFDKCSRSYGSEKIM